MIRVFSSPVCVYCATLKQFLRDHSIEFEDINVLEDKEAAQEMIEKTQQMSIPVIDINGEFIVGFDKKRISELLGIKD